MAQPDSQTFLRGLDKKLWAAADRLRSNLDAPVYKHAVPGVIFLSRVERVRAPARGARRVRAGARIKYVSDSFAQRQTIIREQLRDPKSDYYRHKTRPKQLNQGYPTTWRLAAMNMVIRGIGFNFGNELANSFTQDQPPDLCFSLLPIS